MRTIIFTLKLILCLSFCTHTLVAMANTPIRIVADEWPPLSGSNLPSGGFSVQLTKELLQELGYAVRVDFAPWKRIMRTRNRDDYDLVSAMWMSEERKQDFHYTNSYLENKVVFVSQKQAPIIVSNMKAINNKRVGIVSSYAYPEKLLQQPGVIWEKAIDIEKNLKKLLSNRLDAVLGTEVVIRYEAKHLEGRAQLYFDSQNPVEKRTVHMAVNRQYQHHTKLVQQIDAMLETFKQNGRYDQIKKLHGIL